MAEGLILEFDGVTADHYWAVNAALGVDVAGGTGFPPGLLYHAGGAKPGGWVVFEVWESRAAQAAFMEEQLGRALQQGGVAGPPSRMDWLELAASNTAPG